ncbi:unnamed protein product [Vitrella brassicaformis CCMP3155]|uniref:MI domain-containing protein n=1 Tax=Vitrella brassicaformis (strain CCMP3155) TaxID=1169540 RepID=A0A0G4F5K5_VITBC|nr:unnamed protein product [Vitrella brassicaformis CCMP3155]|eukprot:CEM07635.1 unnamed protein product [Vitrella brassicaformis CCMP3155]
MSDRERNGRGRRGEDELDDQKGERRGRRERDEPSRGREGRSRRDEDDAGDRRRGSKGRGRNRKDKDVSGSSGSSDSSSSSSSDEEQRRRRKRDKKRREERKRKHPDDNQQGQEEGRTADKAAAAAADAAMMPPPPVPPTVAASASASAAASSQREDTQEPPKKRRIDEEKDRDKDKQPDGPAPAVRDALDAPPAPAAAAERSAAAAASSAMNGSPPPPEERRRAQPPLSRDEEKELDDYKKRKISHVELESLGRTGGVYIPPFKLAKLREGIGQKEEFSPEFQREAWEALRKSLNGLVNKVNVNNITNLVLELFRENLIRGRGLFARSLLRAQMASPGFTHVYAALLAVVNSKLPAVGELIIKRVILQFRRAYRRNDKIVLLAVIKFLAHMVNQKVASELLALQMVTLLLDEVTDDSCEVAVGFIQECGQVLTQIAPQGMHAIFERFRAILHEGEIDKRVQYVIEKLFETRRKQFADFVGVIKELDLVEEDDQITHEIDLLDNEIKGDEMLNIFKPKKASEYKAEDEEWKRISKEILGEGDEGGGEGSSEDSEEDDEGEDEEMEKAAEKIVDYTEQDLINLRRTVYLAIMSSLNFEECVHKLMKLNIKEGHEMEVCTMLIDCCAQERTFQRFFALQGERLCRINQVYQEAFAECFVKQYQTVHRLETNKLRNTAKFFAHLIYTDALPWTVLIHIRLTEETTTSSSRIFIKILFQELSEHLGLAELDKRLQDPTMKQYYDGIFPTDHPKNIRFAINFFTAIGLGGLTERLREELQTQQTEMMKMKMKMQAKKEESSSSSSSSSSDSDSDSDSSKSSR